jgi:putative redox protein
MRAELRYLGKGLELEARLRGHRITLDSAASPGSADRGPSPKELLLASILGCTAMDVVSHLRKHRVTPASVEVSAEAEQTDAHPRVFRQVDLVYDFTGEDLPLEVLEAAVRESLTLYCGVSAMVAPVSPIFYALRVNGEIEARGQARFPAPVAPPPARG